MNEPVREARTLFQFSLRSLFVAAVVVAVPAAAAAPWVRTLQSDQLLRLAAGLCLMFLVIAVSIVIACRHRWQLEQETGKLLMRVSTARRFWYHFGYLLGIVLILLIWLDDLHTWVISATPPLPITSKALLDLTDWVDFVVPYVVLTQMVAFYVVYVVWWRIDPTTVEAREKGLLVRGRRVLLWTSIKSHRWKKTGPADLMLQLPCAVVDVQLLPRDKEAFDRLLHEMCAKQEQAPEPETSPPCAAMKDGCPNTAGIPENESEREARLKRQGIARSLAATAAAAAMLSTIVVPCIWPLQRDRFFTRLGIVLGGAAVIALGIAAVHLRRWRFERRNGKLLMRLSSAHLERPDLVHRFIALTASWFAYQSVVVWVVSAELSDHFTATLFLSVVLCFQLVPLQLVVPPAEPREAGLVLADGRVLHWSAIQSYRWGGPSPSTVTLQLDHEVVNLPLLAQDRKAFDRLLHEMCTK